MIDQVRDAVLFIVNKENRGYITPSEFNNYGKMAQMDIFEGYFTEYNKAVYRQRTRVGSSGYGDKTKMLSEVISIFNTEQSLFYSPITQHFLLPTNMFQHDGLYYDTTTEITIDTKRKTILANNTMDGAANLDFPMGYFAENTDTISTPPAEFSGTARAVKIFPSSIVTDVYANYIRLPKDPNWTYSTLVNNEPIFDPSQKGFQDFEIPDNDIELLVTKILSYAGVQIKDPQVVQYALRQNEVETIENRP